MQLPLSERAAVANAILESMSPDESGATQAEIDAAWESEIANRITFWLWELESEVIWHIG